MADTAFDSDLGFLYHALLKHPMIVEDAESGKRKEFEQFYHGKICREPVWDEDSFLSAAEELTMFFRDGHTNIEVPYTEKDRCINLRCAWGGRDADRLILAGQYREIPAGAEITAVGGVGTEELVRRLSQKIPHENIYLVRSRMTGYPYQNYHAFSEMNLNRLFGRKESYPITFAAGGKEITLECPLEDYKGVADFADDSGFISYEIRGNALWLHLDSCICNEKYLSALAETAQVCGERGLGAFVLDLSRNMGGSSAVIDEFIKYTNVDAYRRYEMTDYSSGEPRTVSCRRDVVRNQKKPISFPAEMYCKVSCDTFSSARTFAVTLKDNKIAKIVGTPTGGKPDSYGMPRKLKMPHSGIRFRVSTSIFLRPDESKDDEITLLPDSLYAQGRPEEDWG